MRIWVVILMLMGATVARAEDYATRMVEATYKLYNSTSTATGFFVTPPPGLALPEKHVLLVTAGHVFEKMTGDHAIIVLRRPQPDGTYIRRDFQFKIREGDKPLWIKHPTQDTAVMSVELPDDSDVRPIDFDWLADEPDLRSAQVHIGSELLMLGFPMRVEANAAGFPIARHVTIASFPLTPVKLQKTFLADFTTFAGDSGGPVFLDRRNEKNADEASHPLIVGIVLAQHFSNEKLKLYYEEQIIHHPLNLATILQAHYVREVIQAMGETATSVPGPTSRPIGS